MFKPKIKMTDYCIEWDFWNCDSETEYQISKYHKEHFYEFFGVDMHDFLNQAVNLERVNYKKSSKQKRKGFHISSGAGRVPARYESLIRSWVKHIEAETKK